MDYTKFEEIYKLFLMSIQDYSLRNLFMQDEEVAEDMLQYFMFKSLPKFRSCRKNIKDLDLNNKSFKDNLDMEEKMIISDLMVLSWMDRMINDITQMNLNLNDNDWRLYSVIQS